ncbi:MAG: DNRLRE domain-containing protein [Candidatus Eisenbacteria bacterium]|uniref:DNRLRE domain-containing protein n=1 Tax=Eiseniibacteriota bacterium TaxID=2212470 RepID=A0A7Y2H1F4_UNCEI|nr:DNRLRE domain-containing protein [Candidatus Eisenbacteria bacterium]
MRIFLTLCSLVALQAFGLTTSIHADVAKIAPEKSALCPDDGSGKSYVLLSFDLSGLRSGEGRVIDEAYLEWIVPSLPSDGLVEFSIHQMESGWDETRVAAGQDTPDWKPDEESGWSIEPLDYQRHGGLVRLSVRTLVESWLEGTEQNHGLFIKFTEKPSAQLPGELSEARLVIRYGFIK